MKCVNCSSIMLFESQGGFCSRLYILPQENFVFAPTAPCIIHLLKVHCCSVSLGQLYKYNVWIVSPFIHLKVRAIFAAPPYILPQGECVCSNCSIYCLFVKSRLPLYFLWYVIQKKRVDCSLLLYSKVKANICILKILKFSLGFHVNFKISNNLQTSACHTRDKLVAFYIIII